MGNTCNGSFTPLLTVTPINKLDNLTKLPPHPPKQTYPKSPNRDQPF